MQKKSFSINPFDHKIHELFRHRKRQRVQEKYKTQHFYDRTAKVALWLLVLSFGCSLFSAYSEHFYLRYFLESSLQQQWLSLGLVFLLVAVIEAIKRSVIPGLFQYYFQYGRLDLVSTVIVVVFCGLSIFASFEGAKHIPQQLATPPALVSLDSIKQEYAAQIVVLDGNISRQERTTWKGRITAQANKNITQLSGQKAALLKAEQAASAAAFTHNEEMRAAFELELLNTGSNIGYATLVNECLLLLIIGFLEYRDFTLFALNGFTGSAASDTADKSSINAPSIQMATTATSATNDMTRTAIGFKSYEAVPHNDERCVVKEKTVTVNNRDRVRDCLHCSTTFTYKHWNKQYCSTNCRVQAWELRTGKKMRRKPKKVIA